METETKYNRFKRLANQRGDRLLKDLELLGNLSNRNNYEYTEADIKKIFSAIDEETRRVKLKFTINKRRKIEL